MSLSRRAMLAGIGAAAAMPALRARAAVTNNVVIGTNGWLYPAWDDIRNVMPSLWGKATDSINSYVAQLKGHGIETVISLTPTKGRTYPEFLPADFRASADSERRYSTCLGLLRAPGTLVPDIYTFFAQLRANAGPVAPAPSPDFLPVGNDLFFKADSHWTTVASEPNAAEFAKQIQAKFNLPPSAKPGVQLGAGVDTVQERNDLGELLPPPMPDQYPFQMYSLPAVAAATGDNALLADDGSDVVVIGNSWMQPKYGFADKLSNSLNRPVALNWKIDRYGPYTTLMDYLQSAAFKSTRPKVIVWNFREPHMEYLISDTDAWGPSAMSSATLAAAIDKAAG